MKGRKKECWDYDSWHQPIKCLFKFIMCLIMVAIQHVLENAFMFSVIFRWKWAWTLCSQSFLLYFLLMVLLCTTVYRTQKTMTKELCSGINFFFFLFELKRNWRSFFFFDLAARQGENKFFLPRIGSPLLYKTRRPCYLIQNLVE